MKVLEQIRTAATGREVDVLCEGDRFAWARTIDLVIGCIEVTPDTAERAIDAAYDELERQNVLREHELWNVVLIVFITGDQIKAAQCARRIEHDLTRSRKLAVLPDQEPPRLFAAFDLSTASVPASTDPIAAALDHVCHQHERAAIKVLLRERRNSVELQRLLDILGSDGSDPA